jgi:hypothetical protein
LLVIEGSIFMRAHNTVYRRYVTGLRLALTTQQVADFYFASDIKAMSLYRYGFRGRNNGESVRKPHVSDL